MDKNNTYIIAGIVIVAILIFVGVSLQKSVLDTSPSADLNVSTTTDWEVRPAEVAVNPKTVITAKHAYRNGEHVVAGETQLPTPCHLLESAGVVSEDKKSAVINFTSSVKTDEVCAQVLTPARFKVSLKADKSAKLTATLNGQEVTLNLIEATPDEDLDNFQLYIKG